MSGNEQGLLLHKRGELRKLSERVLCQPSLPLNASRLCEANLPPCLQEPCPSRTNLSYQYPLCHSRSPIQPLSQARKPKIGGEGQGTNCQPINLPLCLLERDQADSCITFLPQLNPLILLFQKKRKLCFLNFSSLRRLRYGQTKTLNKIEKRLLNC